MDVPAKFGDSRLNSCQIIRLFGWPDPFYSLLQCLIAFCSRPEAASDVMSGRFVRPIVLDKCVKFCDPCLNRSREIPPEAVGGSIFDSFYRDNFRLEAVSDVISSATVQ